VKRLGDSGALISLCSVLFILMMSMAMSGCADTMNYVRHHKGEGSRRVLQGSEAEFMDAVAKRMTAANFYIVREPHAVLANESNTNLSYAFYFYPSKTNNQTEVEVLMASSWLTAEQLRREQELELQKLESRTDVSKGLTKEDLTTIVQAAVDGSTKSQKKEAKPKSIETEIDKPSFAVAKRIFGDNDISVVIGIEGYQALPKSDYSYDDARLVKDYLKALGFKERNIELITDEKATKSSIEKTLEVWLRNKAKPDSKVLVYYSGHGAPDPSTGEAYLVPYDGDANYLSVTGYPLKRLYDNLGKLQVEEVVVLLDSCFSGAGGRSVLAKGARPLVMMASSALIPQNMAVLSATQGTQISTSSPEKGHGVFTYYFLKALKDGKKNLVEIYDYIKPQVEDEAKQLNVQQSPSISPDVAKLRGKFVFIK